MMFEKTELDSGSDMLAEPQGGDTIVYAFRREHFDYHCECNDLPPLTEQEFEALPRVVAEFHDEFIGDAIDLLRFEN